VTPVLISTAIPERYERLGPPPSETLSRLMAMREALGITRIADITGLDRVGIPVVQVVRPFSLSNAVSQGKGHTMIHAAISAILESAEACFAERLAHFDTVVASASSLNIPSDRLEAHLQHGVTLGWRDRETAWIPADNLLDGDRDMVPFELVHTGYVLPPRPHDGIFAASTTGLAASFEETDAIVHGILECVERDAIARANRTHGFFQNCRIDPKTIDDPAIFNLLATLDDRGLMVGLWHASSPVGLPVIWCHLMENTAPETALLHHPADGSAASFDLAAATAHAIYEAAQSRLAAISGARDDITRAFYPKYPDWRMIAAHRRLIAEGQRSVHFRALAEQNTERAGDRLSILLAMLEDCGINSVNMVRIETAPLTDLTVVRIIIPALLPYLEG
jgi:YcaO-like protein with predicted kinase domain